MLQLSENFYDFLFNREQSQHIAKIVLDDTTTEPDTGIDGVEHDISEFVISRGNVSKELQFQDGIYRPGSHQFELSNTKDAGDFLFTLRKHLGLNTWINKSYRVLYGFRKQAITAPAVQDTYSTAPDIQDVYGGLVTQDTYYGSGNSEEFITLYRGVISGKTEDRINEKVSVRSGDALKYLSDYKFCIKRVFNAAHNLYGFTDNRIIQPVLKYGTFNLADVSEESAFPADIGMANNIGFTYSAINIPIKGAWLFPCDNNLIISAVYFWDYIQKRWRVISPSLYAWVQPFATNDSCIIITGLSTNMITGQTSTYTDYLNGTGYFARTSGTLPSDNEIKVVANTYVNQYNPIDIIKRLLTLASVSSSHIDVSSVIGEDTSKSFDYAYNRFETEEIKINIDFRRQTSVLSIIQKIGELVGCALFYSPDESSTVRRNFKIAIDKYLSPCADKPEFISFATNDNILSLTMEQSSDSVYSGVVVKNYDINTSRKNNFDDLYVGSTSDLLNGTNIKQFGSESVYLYDSHVQAEALVNRRYNEYRESSEKYTLTNFLIGLVLELGDYVNIYDHKISETIIARVNNQKIDLTTGKVTLILERFGKLYGPDSTNPYKVWAFCDCAKAGTSREGGYGSDASIIIGTTTVTLADGTTDSFFQNMRFRIGGTSGGTSGSEYFTVDEILTSTTFSVKVAAVATHSNESWSTGKSYFVR